MRQLVTEKKHCQQRIASSHPLPLYFFALLLSSVGGSCLFSNSNDRHDLTLMFRSIFATLNTVSRWDLISTVQKVPLLTSSFPFQCLNPLPDGVARGVDETPSEKTSSKLLAKNISIQRRSIAWKTSEAPLHTANTTYFADAFYLYQMWLVTRNLATATPLPR